MSPVNRSPGRRSEAALLPGIVAIGLLAAACGSGSPEETPSIHPGSSAVPREVNLIASDYAFVPAVVDLVPGETVVIHFVNGGLTIHEAVIGDRTVQDAWETAESAAADPPPGPTPLVSVPPDRAGLRLVARSGDRVDATWTVPADASGENWFVGCHIPGHWARGMLVPVRFVAARPARSRITESR